MPWATVEGNIALPLQILKAPQAEIRSRVGEMILLRSWHESAVEREG